MPEAPETFNGIDTDVYDGKFMDLVADIGEFEMLGGDPFGLDDIMNFPAQF